jgi:hypothetical protein
VKSYSAYFVKSECLDKAQKLFKPIAPVPGTPWLICDLHADDSPPADDVLWGKKSLLLPRYEQLTEIFFVYGDVSGEGSFVYEHAQKGELVRKLVWFPMLDDNWTAGWLCASGQPEPWEAPLFSARALTIVLEFERSRCDDEGRSAEFRKIESEIRRLWAAKTILAGKTYPSCDGTVAKLVERSYGINRQ